MEPMCDLAVMIFVMNFYFIFCWKTSCCNKIAKKNLGRTCADGIPVGTGVSFVPNGQACADGSTVGTAVHVASPGTSWLRAVPTVIPSAQE